MILLVLYRDMAGSAPVILGEKSGLEQRVGLEPFGWPKKQQCLAVRRLADDRRLNMGLAHLVLQGLRENGCIGSHNQHNVKNFIRRRMQQVHESVILWLFSYQLTIWYHNICMREAEEFYVTPSNFWFLNLTSAHDSDNTCTHKIYTEKLLQRSGIFGIQFLIEPEHAQHTAMCIP